ncbi:MULTISPECIES: serine/threonine-protein kinase [unclassified Streptomyces]|uniref:serine/threonine-protein kinase n=2 Tax=Streptomyces TaxID=1883 RepID=UPI002E1EB51B
MEQGMGPPGQVLGGRYRVGNQLGHGGFGGVWEAYDEVLDRRVAVKAVTSSHREAMRFARLAALVHHPNLVTVHDFVEADGVLWYVMPLVSGPSLAEYLAENGQMSGRQVREVAKALLDALAALHEAGVVHGGVRPANILMDEVGWKLLPGIAVMARDDDPDTTEHEWLSIGAAGYVAPERLRGAPQEPSNDLFSLGVTLHELVTGRPPFQRGDVWRTLAAVEREEPPALGGVGVLEWLIKRLLDKDPEQRPSAAQARQVLLVEAEEVRQELWSAQALMLPPLEMQKRPGLLVMPPMPKPVPRRNATVLASSLLLLLSMLTVALVWGAGRAHVAAGYVSGLFVSLWPWALFALGLSVLGVQVRAALTRRRARGLMPAWRWYASSLAPPARWTIEEWDRRRAAAERAVDEALLTVDRRVASASPGPGTNRGTTDV